MTHTQKPLRIVLIEDRTVAAITLECLLEDLGHKVSAVAATPLQAGRVLKDPRTAADLVIFDAFLIGLPSLNLAKKLKQFDMPVVITSTKPESELRALGFDEPYLAQPFAEADVAKLMSNFAHLGTVAA